MRVRPLHNRVLIRRIEEQDTIKGGIIIPDTAKEKSQEGEVVAVGTGKMLENGTLAALEVKEGDRILFGKYSGTEIKVENQDYLILREDEIMRTVLDPFSFLVVSLSGWMNQCLNEHWPDRFLATHRPRA